jgi:DNA-binding FrmR family transcriptional regulator
MRTEYEDLRRQYPRLPQRHLGGAMERDKSVLARLKYLEGQFDMLRQIATAEGEVKAAWRELL